MIRDRFTSVAEVYYRIFAPCYCPNIKVGVELKIRYAPINEE